MMHECPKCKSLWECIYEHCKVPRVSVCFVCYSKPWHTFAEWRPK